MGRNWKPRRYQPESHVNLPLAGAVNRFTARYRARKKQAMGWIEDAFSLSENPYLAISGGKDSVAMLALVAEVADRLGRQFTCWGHVSDASFPGTRATIRRACKKAGAPLILDESPVSAWDVIGLQSRARFGKTGWFFERIKAFVGDGGYDLVFVGVRAMESKRRFEACVAKGPVFKSGDILKCHPLQWFGIEDVAAVLVEYDMPIHPIYDMMPVDTLPVRLGYATSLDLIDRGTVVFLRRNYPDLYQRLVNAYPAAANYR